MLFDWQMKVEASKIRQLIRVHFYISLWAIFFQLYLHRNVHEINSWVALTQDIQSMT